MRLQLRSFSTSLRRANNVSQQLKDLPSVSGGGPFPLLPQFQPIGTPPSLVSVSLPASSTLFARRGSIVSINGQLDTITSRLSSLSAFARTVQGMPFLYNRISATAPATLLVSTNTSYQSSLAIVSLDGRTDWTVAQRDALFAWAGAALHVQPNTSLFGSSRGGTTRWGNTYLTGRGDVALVGRGQIFKIDLTEDEDILVHPANLLAYTTAQGSTNAHGQFVKLNHSAPLLQLPKLPFVERLLANNSLLKSYLDSDFHRAVQNTNKSIRKTWAKWFGTGNQLLQIQGPRTILIQSQRTDLRQIVSRNDLAKVGSSD